MKNYLLRFLLLTIFPGLLMSCQKEAKQLDKKLQSIFVYPKKNPIKSFKLSSQKQADLDNSLFDNRWNLITMGFTQCPDICPDTLTKLTQIYNQLSPEMQKKYQVIFLSVDPKRDSVKHLSDYLSYFHEDFVGITGNKKNIDLLVKSLGGLYTINSESEEYYTVDHTSRIFVVNPKGERFAVISSEAMENKDKAKLVEELEFIARNNS